MSTKKTIRIKVLDDLDIALVFKNSEEIPPKKDVKVILPDVVKKRWEFKSLKEEAAFAGFASAVGNEYIAYGASEKDVAGRFKILVERTVNAGLLQRCDENQK